MAERWGLPVFEVFGDWLVWPKEILRRILVTIQSKYVVTENDMGLKDENDNDESDNSDLVDAVLEGKKGNNVNRLVLGV